MRYEGRLYRPPSEADALIVQATIGCSWNRCTYCDMYRDKVYRERELPAVLEDLRTAVAIAAHRIDKLFVADGDALGMATASWLAILDAARAGLPQLRRVSCYATAANILKKTPAELATLRERGLTRLYIGPESGDDATMKRPAPPSDESPAQLISRRIADLGDWRGETLARLRALILLLCFFGET